MATVKEIPMDAIGVAVLSEQDNTFSFREEQGTARNTFHAKLVICHVWFCDKYFYS